MVLASPLKLPVSQDDDSVEEYEPNVTFTPLVDLPALVEVKTGEEDESVVSVSNGFVYASTSRKCITLN